MQREFGLTWPERNGIRPRESYALARSGPGGSPELRRGIVSRQWCNSGEAVVILGRAGSIKQSRRRAA